MLEPIFLRDTNKDEGYLTFGQIAVMIEPDAAIHLAIDLEEWLEDTSEPYTDTANVDFCLDSNTGTIDLQIDSVIISASVAECNAIVAAIKAPKEVTVI